MGDVNVLHTDIKSIFRSPVNIVVLIVYLKGDFQRIITKYTISSQVLLLFFSKAAPQETKLMRHN